jgi:hypothetical protein
MANGLGVLQNLLKMRTPAPNAQAFDPVGADPMDEYISDLDLKDAQSAYTTAQRGRKVRDFSGAEYEAPIAVPSRQEIREQGRTGLRHEAQGQNAALMKALLPAQTTGEYGLERERISQEGNVRAAGMKASTDAGTRQDVFAQQLLRDRLNNQDIGERQAASQGAVAQRGQATQAGVGNRQMIGDLMLQRRQKQAALAKGQGLGVMDWFTGRQREGKSEIDALTARIDAMAQGMSEAERAVAAAAQSGITSFEQFLQQGGGADTPEELAELQAAFAALTQGQ